MSALAENRQFGNRGAPGNGFLITAIVTALIGLIFGVFASLGMLWLAPVGFG